VLGFWREAADFWRVVLGFVGAILDSEDEETVRGRRG
jgi:hypothetical protein